eukprot:787716_1
MNIHIFAILYVIFGKKIAERSAIILWLIQTNKTDALQYDFKRLELDFCDKKIGSFGCHNRETLKENLHRLDQFCANIIGWLGMDPFSLNLGIAYQSYCDKWLNPKCLKSKHENAKRKVISKMNAFLSGYTHYNYEFYLCTVCGNKKIRKAQDVAAMLKQFELHENGKDHKRKAKK